MRVKCENSSLRCSNGGVVCSEILSRHAKLTTTGSVNDKRRNGCPSTGQTLGKLAKVQEMFNQNQQKSSRQAVHAVLDKKKLHKIKSRTLEELEFSKF